MSAKNILIVDDDHFIHKALSRFLTGKGHRVECADNALEALELLKAFKADIIFIDLIMPRISGDILCRVLRHSLKFRDCYLVILSAAVVELDYDYTQVGANACIAKGPLDVMSEHILQVVEAADGDNATDKRKTIRGKDAVYSRQITKELLSQNQDLKIILESMSEGLLEAQSNRVIYANAAAINMLDMPYEELIGAYLPGLLGIEDHALAGQEVPLHDRIFIESLINETFVLNDKQVAVKAFPVQGEKDLEVILLQDVTETKRMESIIEAANFTENLGYVFSGIRHEIGNPVNSIKMALSVLNKNLANYDKDAIGEFVQRALIEVSRIEYLLKVLKNFSLFEKPDVQRIWLDSFMEDFLSLVKNDFVSKGFHIETRIEPGDKWGFVDARALHHVLLNIFTNAADAVETEASPRITLRMSKETPWIKISVDDNGCGISEEDKSNIFKPFYTSKAHGSGLGLVIVQKMLSTMNCHIEVSSRKKIGTTATISIPEAKIP